MVKISVITITDAMVPMYEKQLMDEYFAGVSGVLCFFDGFTHNCGQTNYYITVSHPLRWLATIHVWLHHKN